MSGNELKESLVVEFNDGIYGFNNLTEFVFYKTDDDKSPITIMQSTQNPNINFLVIPPTLIEPDYEIELDSFDIEDMKITSEKEVVVLAILAVIQGKQYISANLKSPIIFSLKSKLGKQIIFDDSKYNTKHIVKIENMEN
jgi:flagellar assembly factor FliW